MFGNALSAKGQHSPHVLLRYWSIKPHIIPLLTASSPLNTTIGKEFKKLFNVAFTNVLHFPFSLDDYAQNSLQD